jgi:hypothetical protein
VETEGGCVVVAPAQVAPPWPSRCLVAPQRREFGCQRAEHEAAQHACRMAQAAAMCPCLCVVLLPSASSPFLAATAAAADKARKPRAQTRGHTPQCCKGHGDQPPHGPAVEVGMPIRWTSNEGIGTKGNK